MATELEIYEHYENVFKFVYADLVAVTGDKPREVLFELEACFAHLAVAKTSSDENDDCFKKNIDRAYNHIIRASLDTVKLLWLALKQEAAKFFNDKDVVSFAGNVSKLELLTLYKNAEEAAKSARTHEVNNVGKFPEKSVDEWYFAVQELNKFIGAIDPNKVSDIRKYLLRNKAKEYFIGFILGIIASTVVSWCWPTNPLKKQIDIQAQINVQREQPHAQ